MKGRIAVVGGSNVDIGGFSKAAIIKGDSNPGRVQISPGGVGRNIAEGCARLGLEVELVTAIGKDPNGDYLRDDCRRKGIGLAMSLNTDLAGTSVYLFIDDSDGDMYCAINDMQIQQLLTPEYLEKQLDYLNACQAVVLDANLAENSIKFLSENLTVPIFADTVSAAKAPRLKAVLPSIFCLKTNRLEAGLLTGMEVNTIEDAETAAKELLRAGVKTVYLTLGDKGSLCAERDYLYKTQYVSKNVVNATGAGDAYMAALVWAFSEGYDTEHMCTAGLAASTIAVESVETVSPKMSRTTLTERIEKIKKSKSEA